MINDILSIIEKKVNHRLAIILNSFQLVEYFKSGYENYNIFVLYSSKSEYDIIKHYYKFTPITSHCAGQTFDVLIGIDKNYISQLITNNNITYICCFQSLSPLDRRYIRVEDFRKNYWYLKSSQNMFSDDEQQTDELLQLTNFPILIRTKNRVNYLRYTLHSLLDTILYNSDITIMDDGSTNSDCLHYLYKSTNCKYSGLNLYNNLKTIYPENFQQNLKLWNDNIGILPELDVTEQGIANKIKVKQFEKSYGDCKGLLETIKYGFETNVNSPFIIVLQDDIIFNKNWLTEIFRIYQNVKDKNVGIISVYNNKESNSSDFYVQDLECTGQCLLITREFYSVLQNNGIFEKEFIEYDNLTDLNSAFIDLEKYNMFGDTHLAYYCKQFGFNIFKSVKSYIQHIGVNSTYNHNTLRLATNFVGDIAFRVKLYSLIPDVKRVLIFSNINFLPDKIKELNIVDSDLLVFLNTSVPLKYFSDHMNKVILFRWSGQKHFGFSALRHVNCKKYGVDGRYMCMTAEQFEDMKLAYSQEYYAREEVQYKNSLNPYHIMRNGPTTGWFAQYYMRLRYPKAKIELVNFFPTADVSTPHFTGHDWKFENEYYQNINIKVYDLRQQMHIVYVLDNKEKYIELCKMSAASLLKYNPTADITIVSAEPINALPYKNVVLPEIAEFNYLHKENDRLSNAIYLKLFLEQLPYDRCMFIDTDTLILNNLYNIYTAEIPYIGAVQTWNIGKKQALELGHEKYYLSAMMIMNLKALREIHFAEMMTEYSNEVNINDYIYWTHEELLLNKFFYDKLTDLHIKYCYCYNRPYENPLNEDEVIIMHFIGADKSPMYTHYQKLNI